MIRFSEVSKVYSGGNKPALQGISFHLPVGGMAYVTGHSGAGKSTLLKLILGIERANGGNIWFNGHDITRLPAAAMPYLRRQIGMVHQDYRLLTNYTVLDNVGLPLVINGTHPAEVKRRASAALDRVGLFHRANYYPQQLSGGEQQRIDIARAIVNKPPLLLADEPTGNLDKALSLDIFNLFAQLNQLGVTVLIATHDVHMIAHNPKPTIVLEQGHLKQFIDQ